MAYGDPWNWRNWSDPRGDEPIDPNQEHAIRCALAAAFSLFCASLYPADAVAPMLAFFLLVSAAGAALGAWLRGEPVWSPRLTGWDEAAALAALGFLVAIVFPAPGAGLPDAPP